MEEIDIFDWQNVVKDMLTLAFRDFYLKRKADGLPVEKPRARMARVDELTEADIQRLILDMPFRKFAQRGFLRYDRDASRVRFAPTLWTKLSNDTNLRQVRTLSQDAIANYYARIKSSDSPTENGPNP